MAPLLDLQEVWLTVAQVKILGGSERTLRHQRDAGRVIQRTSNGRIEVLLSSLPHKFELKYAEQLAQTNATLESRAAAQLALPSARERLARFRPEVAAAFIREAKRRFHLLARYELVDPKSVVRPDGARIASIGVEEILADWPCSDPLILITHRSWGEPCDPRTLRRARNKAAELGALALIPAAPIAGRDDDLRLRPIPAHIQSAITHLRLKAMPNATWTEIERALVREFGSEAPQRQRIKRFYDQTVPKAVDMYMRQGERTYKAKLQTPIHRDYSKMDVGDVYCGDHHEIDLAVINDKKGGRWDRVWITLWFDVKSRAPVGWAYTFEPNSQSATDAFLHAVRPKNDPVFDKLCGTPVSVYIDNGKDFRSKRLEGTDAGEGLNEGLFAALNVRVIRAIPYNAKAKIVERFFLTAVEQFSRSQLGYCGRRSDERTERFREMCSQHDRWVAKDPRFPNPAFMTMAELATKFDAWIVEYMKRAHEGLEDEHGRTFCPAEMAAQRVRPVVMPRPETLQFVAMKRYLRYVRKSLIELDDLRYEHDELLLHEGKQVECRVDGSDLTSIYVSELGGRRFICKATSRVAMSMSSDGKFDAATRAEWKRQQRQDKQVRQAGIALAERAMEGKSALDVALEKRLPPSPPSPTTPASTSARPIEGSVTDFRPDRDRVARQAMNAEVAPPAEPVPADIVLLVPPSEEEQILAEIGPRPDPPTVFMSDRQREWAEQQISDWEAARASLIAARRAPGRKLSSIGGPP